jgi:hypothetical protein
MIVAKLLHVVLQPVYVLVDTDTADVAPAPPVQSVTLPTAQLHQIPALIEQGREQLQRFALEQMHGTSEGHEVPGDSYGDNGENDTHPADRSRPD